MIFKDWKICELLESEKAGITIIGNPLTDDSPYGKAVHFNGIDNGIVFTENPVSGLTQFTVEMVFMPESGGQFEQRFLHCGLVQGDRLLLELRSAEQNQWYYDAFLAAGESSLALVDKDKLHPCNQWHHAAFVIDNGNLISYINGNKELEGKINFTPMPAGATSIGMRQNQISWFKGVIYNLRITDLALQPAQFIRL